jgi:hypothetical protein
LFSIEASQRSPLHFELGKNADGCGADAGRGLLLKNQTELMQHDRLLRVRLGIARHNQKPAICGGKRDVQHLDSGELLQHRSRRQSRRVSSSLGGSTKGFGSHQNDVRYSAGVVFRLGEK